MPQRAIAPRGSWPCTPDGQLSWPRAATIFRHPVGSGLRNGTAAIDGPFQGRSMPWPSAPTAASSRPGAGDWHKPKPPGDLWLWDAATGERIAELSGHGARFLTGLHRRWPDPGASEFTRPAGEALGHDGQARRATLPRGLTGTGPGVGDCLGWSDPGLRQRREIDPLECPVGAKARHSGRHCEDVDSLAISSRRTVRSHRAAGTRSVSCGTSPPSRSR